MKFYKKTGIFIGIFAVLGFIFCALGVTFGADLLIVLSAENGIEIVEDGKCFEYNNMDMEQFTSIHVDCEVAKISIVESTDGKYGVKAQIYNALEDSVKVDVKNDKLTIEDVDEEVKISLNIGEIFSTQMNEIVIYVPADTTLKDIYVNNSVGEIEVKGIEGANRLELIADVGDVLVSGGYYKKVKIQQNVGDIDTSGISVYGDLTVYSDMGDVELDGTFSCDINIKSDVGDVDIKTTVGEHKYNYDISADLGDVKVFGEKGDKYKENINGIYKMTIKTDVGDIEVE